jgi:hypothetical protein
MFLEFDLDDVKEAGPAPTGKYELQITGAVEAETKAGAPMLVATLGFTDTSLHYNTFKHNITLPVEGDEKAEFKKLMLKRFLAAFDVPFRPGMDSATLTVNMIAQTAFVEVKLNEPNANGYVSNSINLPRLPDEGQGRRR